MSTCGYRHMITLKDSIEIKAAPEKVFEWLTNLRDKESYQTWHPDHVECIWVKGEPFQKGSIVYFEEYIHGKLHKAKFLCTKSLTLSGSLRELLGPSFELYPTGLSVIGKPAQRAPKPRCFSITAFLQMPLK